ncbi:hypothetical protein H0O03_03355 [Candidatus Micrarchaeota archaeon]|nr:hypothetical protein [Candidatus Micrarchaeota archaeon]
MDENPEQENIHLATVLADAKEPFLRMRTRWSYLESQLDTWKDFVRYRTAMYLFAVLGIISLFVAPIGAPLLLGLAAYYFHRKKHAHSLVISNRVVMVGH